MKYVGKDGLKVNGKEVWHEGNFDPDGKQDALGYTPVNKAGDTMGRLEVTGSTTATPGLTITGQRANLLFNTIGATGGTAFRVVQADITNTDNNTSTVASIGGYGSANLGGNPTSNYMYLDARTDGTWNKATLKVDSQDRVGIGIASSGRPTETLDVNGKIRMRVQTTVADGNDIVTTKKYVDDGLGGKVDNSKVLTNVPANAKFTDTIYTHPGSGTNPHGTTKSDVGLGSVLNYGISTQTEAEAGTSNAKYMTPLRVKQSIDKFKPKKLSELTNDIGAGGGINIITSPTEPPGLATGDQWHKEI